MTPDNILPKLPKSSLGRLLALFLFPSFGLRRPDLPIFSVKASLQVVEVRCVSQLHIHGNDEPQNLRCPS